MADKFGRRWGAAIGIIVVIIGSIIQALPMVNDAMFLSGRFLVGCGSNVAGTSLPLLITELAYPQHRGKLTTMVHMTLKNMRI